jgi:hypothetical protein
MKKMILAAAAAMLLSTTVLADDAAAGSAVDSMAPHSCKKPVILTKMRGADDDSIFDEKAETYKTCINDYVAAQGALAQKHTNNANAAINEFNDFVKEVKAHKDQ